MQPSYCNKCNAAKGMQPGERNRVNATIIPIKLIYYTPFPVLNQDIGPLVPIVGFYCDKTM